MSTSLTFAGLSNGGSTDRFSRFCTSSGLESSNVFCLSPPQKPLVHRKTGYTANCRPVLSYNPADDTNVHLDFSDPADHYRTITEIDLNSGLTARPEITQLLPPLNGGECAGENGFTLNRPETMMRSKQVHASLASQEVDPVNKTRGYITETRKYYLGSPNRNFPLLPSKVHGKEQPTPSGGWHGNAPVDFHLNRTCDNVVSLVQSTFREPPVIKKFPRPFTAIQDNMFTRQVGTPQFYPPKNTVDMMRTGPDGYYTDRMLVRDKVHEMSETKLNPGQAGRLDHTEYSNLINETNAFIVPSLPTSQLFHSNKRQLFDIPLHVAPKTPTGFVLNQDSYDPQGPLAGKTGFDTTYTDLYGTAKNYSVPRPPKPTLPIETGFSKGTQHHTLGTGRIDSPAKTFSTMDVQVLRRMVQKDPFIFEPPFKTTSERKWKK